MAKKVFYDDDARRRVLAGAEILYNAVKTTLGPKGRNVVISKSYGAPTVTHDGVTVAKGGEIADVDDETLGYKVGKEGVVTVEEGQGLSLESEVVEGFTFDRGFVSPYMVTDATRMEAVYSKPVILVTDKKISSIQEFLPILEKLAQAGKKDLVI